MRKILSSVEYLVLGFVLRVAIGKLNIPLFSITSLCITIIAFVCFQNLDRIIWKERD